MEAEDVRAFRSVRSPFGSGHVLFEDTFVDGGDVRGPTCSVDHFAGNAKLAKSSEGGSPNLRSKDDAAAASHFSRRDCGVRLWVDGRRGLPRGLPGAFT